MSCLTLRAETAEKCFLPRLRLILCYIESDRESRAQSAIGIAKQAIRVQGAECAWLPVALRGGSRPDLRQRLAHGQRLGIDLQLDDGGLTCLQRGAQGRREVCGRLDGVAVGAEAARVGGEVRIDERGADHAARIFALLMHADGAVHAVVGDDGDDGQRILHGGRQLLAGHQEAAVALEIDDRAIGVRELGGDRRRQAVAHRAGGRRELRAIALVLEVAMQEGGVVAGAVGDDGVVGQDFRGRADHLGELHGARQRRWA